MLLHFLKIYNYYSFHENEDNQLDMRPYLFDERSKDTLGSHTKKLKMTGHSSKLFTQEDIGKFFLFYQLIFFIIILIIFIIIIFDNFLFLEINSYLNV